MILGNEMAIFEKALVSWNNFCPDRTIDDNKICLN
jgi:hypothetical protein